MNKTIVALSTPIGRSAIAVVRMSGSEAIDIAKKIFCPFPKQANFLRVGQLTTAHFVEQAMCVFFVAPKSYTGEDMVEFHCHGGVAVCSAVIEQCIFYGARLAQNGEFSKRSFLNGKQNLSNAEGVIDMIDAETATAAKAAASLLENKLGDKILGILDELLDIISQTEAALDYPEEDIELPTSVEAEQQVCGLLKQIDELLDTVSAGKTVKYGIDIAIVGKPNVGKSSLLNALLATDRAIVSETAGTTRDTLTESIIFNDIKFNFVDTAGIHDTQNDIEAQGIIRAQKAAENADLILHVVDDIEDKTTFKSGKMQLKLYNKCDMIFKNFDESSQNNKCDKNFDESSQNNKCDKNFDESGQMQYSDNKNFDESSQIQYSDEQNHQIQCESGVFQHKNGNKGAELQLSDREMLISAKNGTNIDKLKQKIFDMFCKNEIMSSEVILTNTRHVQCLTRAKELLNEAILDIHTTTLDCVALKLRAAWEALGEIIGSTATEQIVDRIFSRFCLGK